MDIKCRRKHARMSALASSFRIYFRFEMMKKNKFSERKKSISSPRKWIFHTKKNVIGSDAKSTRRAKFYSPQKVYERHFTWSGKLLRFSSWTCRENPLGAEIFLFTVGGRTGKKLPTKIRAKQPKSSKKVKFISEYLNSGQNLKLKSTTRCHLH